LWQEIAGRYADEPALAGYDLLNEPLPNPFARYNDLVLPLYMDLLHSIRTVDKRHILLLEGVHWATDFSIFDELERGKIDNVILQFHKYWNTPDAESLAPYLACAERLNMPLMMGEGGENNLAWYTTVFPLYEKLGISWQFWAYKKMGGDNSPVTFARPALWDSLVAWLDGGEKPSRSGARQIFDDFLSSAAQYRRNESVIRALKREVPLELPCEAYDGCEIRSNRRPGAALRVGDPVTLLFANGRKGIPDYKRYGGEPQPEEENIVAELLAGETLTYQFRMPRAGILCAAPRFSGGELSLRVDSREMLSDKDGIFTSVMLGEGEHKLHMTCTFGFIQADTIRLSM
jgi:endoglucanase